MDLEKAKIQFDRLKGDFSNVKGPAARNFAVEDGRHVYSATCSWNGSIAKVGSNGGLPACPHCGSMLFEQSADDWHRGIAEYAEAKADPIYPRFIAWLSTRGKCSPLRSENDLNALRTEFHAPSPQPQAGGLAPDPRWGSDGDPRSED